MTDHYSQSQSLPSVISPQQRNQAWEDLGSVHYDIVIIGGGSVGAGAALDAATRGLKVALVEAQDYAAGSSSRSSKMFHGGLRYLAMLDFRLVAESLHERELSMSTLAPHLVKPIKFLFPLTKRVIERPFMFAGFTLYDLMGGMKSVPMQKHYSKRGALTLAPGLKDDALIGAVRYFDTVVDDARHTLTVIRTAARYGATVRSSTEVVGFLKEGKKVTGVTVRDTETGETTEVRGSSVINCTGIWTDELQELSGEKGTFHVHMSKGVHIVIPKDLLESEVALTFVTEKSVLFVIPWGQYWIIGTTDTDWKLGRAHPIATKADIDYILDHVNAKVKRPIGYTDIVGVYAGLRPLLAGASENTTNLSRNHGVARLTDGLISVAGGKYTTYRVIGKDAVDAALADIPRKVPESCTDKVPLLGADGYIALENNTAGIAEQYGITEEHVEHLLNRYGDLVFTVLDHAKDRPELLKPLEGAPEYLQVEVVYGASDEGALHLEDILTRRTRVQIEYDDRGVNSAPQVADLIAPILGWDDVRSTREVAEYIERVEAEKAAERALTDSLAEEIRLQAPEPRAQLVDPLTQE